MASAAVSFTVDRSAPAAPAITSPADQALLGAAAVTISGVAENGSTVTLDLDGVTVLSGADGSTGAFSFLKVLGDGQHAARARATDSASRRTSSPGRAR